MIAFLALAIIIHIASGTVAQNIIKTEQRTQNLPIAKLANCCMVSENALFGLCHCGTPPKRNQTNYKLKQIGTSTLLAARADYFLSKKLCIMNEGI